MLVQILPTMGLVPRMASLYRQLSMLHSFSLLSCPSKVDI